MERDSMKIPTPEVQHLTTIFRRITNGELRIPAFQRTVVWNEDKIIKLLESIYKGYPIGSILLWKVEQGSSNVMQTVDIETSLDGNQPVPFPHVEERYPTYFILDGMQRLSALYGVFFAHTINPKYAVTFNLDTQEFGYSDRNLVDRTLPLSALFEPRKLIDAQQQMSREEDGDILINQSLKLYAAFQDYLLPIVTIPNFEVDEVVEIFERVNSTGANLSRFHFMRALTWSGEFDLTTQVQSLANAIENTGFKFSELTLTKLIAIQLNRNPSSSSMLSLRNMQPSELQAGVIQARKALIMTVDFLREKCKIYSSDFVPYEGQFLTLSKLFQLQEQPSPEIIKRVIQWFWSTSLSESFRGKPDSYVTKDIQSISELVLGNSESLKEKMLLDSSILSERQFAKGKALTSALIGLYSNFNVRSLITGEIISPEAYIGKFELKNFQPVLDLQSMQNIAKRKINSARVMANICVVPEADRKHLEQTSLRQIIATIFERLGRELALQVLTSHFISEVAFTALQEGDDSIFIKERAEFIVTKGKEITSS